ncbi:hypothetical protein D3C80_1911300 [compost metagenome]
MQARIRVLSFQYHSVSASTVGETGALPAGVSTIRLGLLTMFRVRGGKLLCSRRSSRVFHQTTSTAGKSIAPLWVGTSASRSSRLPINPRSLV